MASINRFSIVTLIFFFLSAIFVVHPISFHVPLPFVGKTKLTIGLINAPIISIAILWAAQCIGSTQIRDGIVGTDGVEPYNIIILFIALAYQAITLEVTGVLQAAAYWVSNQGGNNGRRLYLYFYILLTLSSVVLGNDATILSGTPFLVYYTKATDLEPVAWLIAEFAAANTASMVLFLRNPTNVVICEGFRVNYAGFTAYTILPFIACSLACYGALSFQFRDPKHVPPKLDDVTGKLDVWKALGDPVSAIFGSILLAISLVVIVVLSFLRIDVWKVVLPFAGVKFIFDLCWDHYRYTTRRIPHLDDSKSIYTFSNDSALVSEMKRTLTGSTIGRSRYETVTSESSQPQTGLGADLILIRSPSPEIFSTLPSIKISVKTSSRLFDSQRTKLDSIYQSLSAHFPIFFTALPRLPFGLIPFAFSKFILIEGLEHQGWIEVFATWLVKATKGHMIPTIWIVGVLGVILCNVAGTNIGATVLLTKVVRAAPNFPSNSTRAAAISLAVASNIGAVSFTFSASFAGLLWQSILKEKKMPIKQRTFAFWNMLPLMAMTAVGLSVVTAEMVILYP